MAPQKKEEPIDRVRIGSIEAAIWKNQTKNGWAWFNTTLSRSYSDGERLKSTDSLRIQDLPVVVVVVTFALWKVYRLTEAPSQKVDPASQSQEEQAA